MKRFGGVSTALITPFQQGHVDEGSFRKLLQNQLHRGVQGFVINGTTAESPTLTETEVARLFAIARAEAPTDFPLIVGTGSNSTVKTIQDSIRAEKMGADALLVVVPYYNKPPQRGLFEHFKAVAEAVNIPIILYNVPGRTITALELETIQNLSKHPNIIGIKEASGHIPFARQIREACGREFLLLSGDDASYADFMEAGGDGVISVASHILPEVMLQKSVREYLELIEMLFIEANPIPVKMALSLLQIIASPELRLPLATLAPAATEKLRMEMRKKGLLQ
jgi:4-hydroxy-tetrahydrodipicolinate synthase